MGRHPPSSLTPTHPNVAPHMRVACTRCMVVLASLVSSSFALVLQHPLALALQLPAGALLCVGVLVQLESVYPRDILDLLLVRPVLGVDGKQHVREGGAEVGAVDVLVPGCPREEDVVAARAVQLDRRFSR